MISILICGYNETYERNVQLNIGQTIGCEHEILYYKNIGQKGICEVYNLLAQKASGEILCFIHEDIELLTPDWGLKIIEALERFDLVGIAGTKYKSRTPSTMGVNAYYCWNVLQGFKYNSNIKEVVTVFHENYADQDIEEAVCLDGVFLCIKKANLQSVQFDPKNFPNFHGYDFDFCLSAVQHKLRLGVIKTIKLVHFSEGNTDVNWIDAQIRLFQKWKNFLPVYTTDIQFNNPRYLEFLSFKQFFFKMADNHYFKILLLMRLFRPMYTYYWFRYFFNKHVAKKQT